tara:strand:- start:691 stop:1047 length:357 start_codon:yes stop_codon:yes gene_type:complete
MADLKFTLPTSSSLIEETTKKYKNSFQKKVTDFAEGGAGSSRYTQYNQGLRFQLDASKKTLLTAARKNVDAIRKSDLSAQEKIARKAQLQKQVKKIGDELTADFKKRFIDLSKKKGKK